MCINSQVLLNHRPFTVKSALYPAAWAPLSQLEMQNLRSHPTLRHLILHFDSQVTHMHMIVWKVLPLGIQRSVEGKSEDVSSDIPFNTLQACDSRNALFPQFQLPHLFGWHLYTLLIFGTWWAESMKSEGEAENWKGRWKWKIFSYFVCEAEEGKLTFPLATICEVFYCCILSCLLWVTSIVTQQFVSCVNNSADNAFIFERVNFFISSIYFPRASLYCINAQVVNNTSWHCRHHLYSQCKSLVGWWWCRYSTEIAIQTPMLGLLLDVLFISPWEQIHHSLLSFQSLLFMI